MVAISTAAKTDETKNGFVGKCSIVCIPFSKSKTGSAASFAALSKIISGARRNHILLWTHTLDGRFIICSNKVAPMAHVSGSNARSGRRNISYR